MLPVLCIRLELGFFAFREVSASSLYLGTLIAVRIVNLALSPVSLPHKVDCIHFQCQDVSTVL